MFFSKLECNQYCNTKNNKTDSSLHFTFKFIFSEDTFSPKWSGKQQAYIYSEYSLIGSFCHCSLSKIQQAELHLSLPGLWEFPGEAIMKLCIASLFRNKQSNIVCKILLTSLGSDCRYFTVWPERLKKPVMKTLGYACLWFWFGSRSKPSFEL